MGRGVQGQYLQAAGNQSARDRRELRSAALPAMQGKHTRTLAIVAQRGQHAQRGLQGDFAHHAQPASPRAKVANASACASPALRHGM